MAYMALFHSLKLPTFAHILQIIGFLTRSEGNLSLLKNLAHDDEVKEDVTIY